MKLFSIASLSTFLLSTAASAENGVDLYNYCVRQPAAFLNERDCNSFIYGAAKSIEDGAHPSICFPANYDVRQSIPIVKNYLKAHQGALGNSPIELVRRALRETLRCH